jgi:hypothetical protein
MKPSVIKGIKPASQIETAPPRSKLVAQALPASQLGQKTPTSMPITSVQAGRLMKPK